MISIIQLILGTACILAGLFFIVSAVFGNYKFKYVLNRMQASAMGDTLGIFFILAGLIIFAGFSYTTAKIIIVILIFWITSPTSSHLLARMEVSTNEDLNEEVEVIDR